MIAELTPRPVLHMKDFQPSRDDLKIKIKAWEKRRGHNFLHQEHINFFRSLTIFGVFPIHADEQGLMLFKWMSPIAILSILIITIGLSLAVFVTHTIINNLISLDFSFEEAYLYSLMLGFPVMEMLSILNFLEAKKIAAYFNNWDEFHARFELATGRKFPNTRSWKWAGFLLMGIAFAGGYIIVYLKNYFKLLDHLKLNRIMHHMFLVLFSFAMAKTFSVFYLWTLLTGLLNKASEALLADIESLRWRRYGSLQQYLLLWINLRQLCNSLGLAFNMTYLYLCSIMFLFSLPILYVGAYSVSQGNYTSLPWSLNTLLFISSIAELGHRAVHKIGSHFETRLTELLLSGKAMGDEDELLRLIQTVAANPPQLSLGGYFNIDRGINVPMYSSVVTYIVIIIQFSWGKEA